MAKESLGARLRRLREEKGLSRAEFAKRVGASPASVWNWESGTLPRGKALTAIANLFGTSEDFLSTGGGSANGSKGTNGSARASRQAQSGSSNEMSSSVARIMADAKAQIAKASGFPSDQIKLSLQIALD